LLNIGPKRKNTEKAMKLVRSDSPDAVHDIALAQARANRYKPIFLLGLLPNLLILSISALCLLISVRTAVGFGVPAFLAWNAWVIWRTRSPRLSWLIKTRGEQIYIRLFAGFGKAWKQMDTPDVMILEASEIASISIRTIEVFLYGPKPKIVEWLMIEPTHEVVASIPDKIPSFLLDMRPPDFWTPDLNERTYWDKNERRLALGWKQCHPALKIFLQRVAREFPSIVVGTDERSELDLNGVWHGPREGPDAQQRRMLVQARRLGFGPDCVRLLNLYRGMPFQQCAPYLAEIEEEEAAKESAAAQK
jgi:hypothetical protein